MPIDQSARFSRLVPPQVVDRTGGDARENLRVVQLALGLCLATCDSTRGGARPQAFSGIDDSGRASAVRASRCPGPLQPSRRLSHPRPVSGFRSGLRRAQRRRLPAEFLLRAAWRMHGTRGNLPTRDRCGLQARPRVWPLRCVHVGSRGVHRNAGRLSTLRRLCQERRLRSRKVRHPLSSRGQVDELARLGFFQVARKLSTRGR
jgi:hypothetical protein